MPMRFFEIVLFGIFQQSRRRRDITRRCNRRINYQDKVCMNRSRTARVCPAIYAIALVSILETVTQPTTVSFRVRKAHLFFFKKTRHHLLARFPHIDQKTWYWTPWTAQRYIIWWAQTADRCEIPHFLVNKSKTTKASCNISSSWISVSILLSYSYWSDDQTIAMIKTNVTELHFFWLL